MTFTFGEDLTKCIKCKMMAEGGKSQINAEFKFI